MMNTHTVSEQSELQLARQVIANSEHLTKEEKLILAGTITGLQATLNEQERQVSLLNEARIAGDQQTEKLLAELEQKKALLEAQAKERLIEAVLESVRSRSLAMAKTDELYDVVTVVLERLQELGITMKARSAFIAIFDEDKKEMVEWVASPQHSRSLRFTTSAIDHPVSTSIWQAKESGADFLSRSFSVEEKNSYFDYYFRHICCTGQLDHLRKIVAETDHYSYSIAFEKNSAIGIASFSEPPLSVQESEILKRLARAFEQAYLRFLDLQKAEAATREARIEAALERVRSRTLSMQDSRDVGDAIGLLFTELEKLDILTLRCGIFIIDEPNMMLEVWTATSTPEGKVGKAGGRFPFSLHPMLEEAFRYWKRKESFYTHLLAGEDLVNYLKSVQSNNPQYKLTAQNLTADRQFASTFFFNEGALFTFCTEPHTAEAIGILKKFAGVFGLTYRRHLDLKKAEEQAKESLKQASVNRLRAEIASMRSAEDLQRITPLLWKELHTLQVSFRRCGVFIVNEPQKIIEAYLSTPQGLSLGRLTMGVNESVHTQKMYEHWQQQSVYTDQWTKEELVAWMAYLNKANQIAEPSPTDPNLPEVLHLHFAPFTQGMLYVGNHSPLASGEIQLVKSLAEAFAIAYARYEDFRQLEEAKEKLEATVKELKTTQRQLIQAEKMASLGELTAGIAHEIQNPLNFINNFSDINAELLEEMTQELQKENAASVELLAQTIRENEEKIRHHGLRADTIVKGMLQHSRENKGSKEATDINALTDEYLRLSYHGVRAKVKDFKVDLHTDFQANLPKLDLLPQEIGRVLLNLFNNAFYAVNTKKKLVNGSFEPRVKVSTKQTGNKVQIRVCDNGTGIPASVLNKIFQPFFTTKPAGEGTGLGLSLSYEIVTKGHGGELKVSTKEGEYSEFIIELPAS